MKKVAIAALIAVTAAFSCTSEASAQDFGRYGGFGFGQYQPYGIRYSTSVRTPPYFAVNPPVYYGARHTRPYGISPFAALPEVKASSGYMATPATRNHAPAVQPSGCNPYVCGKSASVNHQVGKIRFNPFAHEGDQLVSVEE